ncbi:MAG: hypothetical protein AABX14_04655 [Candidatus Aenigmatarchaeota archaeon]
MYKAIIEQELPDILDKFRGIRADLYLKVAHYCLDVFCSGIRSGALNRPRGIFMRPLDIPDYEQPQVETLFRDFLVLGFTIGYGTRRIDGTSIGGFPEAMDAVDFLSERLGCRDYCGEAVSKILDFGKEKGN